MLWDSGSWIRWLERKIAYRCFMGLQGFRLESAILKTEGYNSRNTNWNNKQLWAGDVAQKVEYLFRMCKSPASDCLDILH